MSRERPAGAPVDRSLAARAAAVVDELTEARGRSTDGAVTWTRGGREFASLGSAGIEIHLDRPIAAAASRTPDVAPSPRGPEWIRFSPRELDAHALDRLRAWLELAYRRAAD